MSAAVDTSVDWALLEADLPSIPCEDIRHWYWNPSGGPATHMYRGCCPVCKIPRPIIAICAGMVSDITRGQEWHCPDCGHLGPAREFVDTLQPIRSTP